MNISPWTNNAKQRTCIPSFKEIVKIKNTVTISVPNDVPVYCMSFYFANSNAILSLKMHASCSIWNLTCNSYSYPCAGIKYKHFHSHEIIVTLKKRKGY